MPASVVYTAVFALFLQNGDVINAEGESYPTEDACLMQAEADAKLMWKEWEWEARRTGERGFYKGVEVRCERHQAAGASGHVGK